MTNKELTDVKSIGYDKALADIKLYNWEAEIVPDTIPGEVRISFRAKGMKTPEAFVEGFMAGKCIIEGIQAGMNNWVDYIWPLTSLIKVIRDACAKGNK